MNDDDLDIGATLRGFRPGQSLFNRYTLTRILGQGGMGIVWLAHDETLGRDVALKFLPEAVALDVRAVDDMKRETRRSLELTHPNIVRIYDFVEDSRYVAISMEYVNGQSLSKMALEKPEHAFDVAEIAPMLVTLCETLTYAHTRAKIVHRDLKPANLMLTKEGELKVADFGISATLTDSTTRASHNANSTSGTPVYMSPQQMMGELAAPTDDIYSLGATIYELLTGKPPFYSGNIPMQVQGKIPPTMAERRKELGVEEAEPIPEAWERTVAACLAKDAAQRPQSTAEVRALLDDDAVLAAQLRDQAIADAEIRRKSCKNDGADLSDGDTVTGSVFHNANNTGRITTGRTGKKPIVPETTTKPSGHFKTLVYALLVSCVIIAVGFGGWWFGIHEPEVRRQAEIARMEAEGKAAEAMRLRNAEERAAAEKKAEETRIAAEKAAAEKAEQERLAREAEKARQESVRIAALRGGLIVRTNPAGAEVMVGVSAMDKSPLTAAELKLGKYPVKIRLAGYEDWAGEVDVEKADTFTELSVNLVRQTGTLAITSEPAGMRWTMTASPEGDTIVTKSGMTPCELKDMPTGGYTIKYSRDGWPDVIGTATVEKTEKAVINGRFAYGSLSIVSDPSGAEVHDSSGKLIGKTPLKVGELIPGKYEFSLGNVDGYKTMKVIGEAAGGKMVAVKAALPKYDGAVTGTNWIVPDYNIEMVWINPGSFMMGLRKQDRMKYDDKQYIGQHQVTLTKGYWIGKYEVTQRQWQAVMGTTVTQQRDKRRIDCPDQNASLSGVGDDMPMYFVSWSEAMEFCRKLTEKERAEGRLPSGYEYSLPTEAQWEYACRAGTTGAYAGNGNLDSMGWYVDNSGGTNHPVGQKQSNAWGLYDMHGNVYEWCYDWYNDYPSGAVTDPAGPMVGQNRIFRGGQWYDYSEHCRSANRVSYVYSPKYRGNGLGFRLAVRHVWNTGDQKSASGTSVVPVSVSVDQPQLLFNSGLKAPQAGKNWTVPHYGIDLVWINPGTFMMGSPETQLGREDSETLHSVTLTQGYWIGKYEVTRGQWKALMGKAAGHFKHSGNDAPVEWISWNDAIKFCNILTEKERNAGRLPIGYEYSLPTEAQWEYACRAGANTSFYYGDDKSFLCQYGNYCDSSNTSGYTWQDKTHNDGYDRIAPVGCYKPNNWGLYDMLGNVFEWCYDGYGPYQSKSSIDPLGSPQNSKKVFRGGCWASRTSCCQSAARFCYFQTFYDYFVGFRLALRPIP